MDDLPRYLLRSVRDYSYEASRQRKASRIAPPCGFQGIRSSFRWMSESNRNAHEDILTYFRKLFPSIQNPSVFKQCAWISSSSNCVIVASL